MKSTHLILTLTRNDAKLIGRDRFLLLMFSFVVYISLVLRYLLPWLNGYLIDTGVMPGERISQSLADFYPLIVGYFAIFQGALISGTIFGFSLLNEKDDDTITAMLVTPVPLKNYVLYRIAAPTVCAFFIVLIMVWSIGQALIPAGRLMLIAAGAALTSPIAALFYGIYAENKVQGFAMAKFIGLVGWVIILGWFVDPPWQWLFGLFPPFWINEAYWMVLAGSPGWWISLVIGVVTQAGLIYWMARRFNAMAYK